MRRLALAAAALAALPFAPAHAIPSTSVSSWVVERVDPSASTLSVWGSAGAHDHTYAFAAVASATVGPDGRFAGADGALFFGLSTESTASVHTPAGTTHCTDLPVAGQACANAMAGGGIAFMVSWTDVDFDRAFVVLGGSSTGVSLGEDSAGWQISPWTGAVHVVDDVDAASATSAFGSGAAAFGGEALATGGANGSIAIGHSPCHILGIPGTGAGAVALTGGDAVAASACPAELYPPAASAAGGTVWHLTGAAAGVNDVPARLVVIDQ